MSSATGLEAVHEAYEDPSFGVDFIVRGEGDLTFRELLRTIEWGGDYGDVAGLYWRRGDRFVRNPRRPESHLGGEILPSKRAAREFIRLLSRKSCACLRSVVVSGSGERS